MANWLNDLKQMLDSVNKPVRVFFRDDDAGWANDNLYRLLDKFTKADMPIDLAVIPESLTTVLGDELLNRWRQDQHFFGLHQHGFSHANHEPAGRKCEFGSSRTKVEQKNDIASGRAVLYSFFGEALDPFFTPPWNRCTQDTVACLEELDFKLLSRDMTANTIKTETLKQVPVQIDWSGIVKKSTNPLTALSQVLVSSLRHNELTGIMLHHANMDKKQLDALTDVLRLFSAHHNVQGLLLRDTLG